jgi:hypothetical protein
LYDAYLPEEISDPEGDEVAVVRYASVLDGVHVSARVGAEIGPIVEHIQYREGQEWKGGARVAWRVGRAFKIVGQVLGPDAEARAGLAWEP